MVKVPPVRSSGKERPLRARSTSSRKVDAELPQRLRVRIANHRHQQPLLRVHRHAHVDVRHQLDGVGREAGVHVGELAQRLRDDQRQQVVVARREAPVFRDLGLQPLAHGHELGRVDLADQGDAGGRVDARAHPVGDDRAHALERDALGDIRRRAAPRAGRPPRPCGARSHRRGRADAPAVAASTSSSVILPPGPVPATLRRSTPVSAASFSASGRGLRRRGQVGQHVALGDAHAAAAGGRDLRQVDPARLRPACARVERRRPPRSPTSPPRAPAESFAGVSETPEVSSVPPPVPRPTLCATNLSSALPMTATTSSTGDGVARPCTGRDGRRRPPRTRRRRSSCRSRSPGSPGPS